MPKAGGLPDVTQRIDLDASGYTRGSDEMVIAALKMAKENRETLKTFADMNDGFGGMATSLRDIRNDFAGFVSVNREVSQSIVEHTGNIDRLNKGYEQIRTHMEYMKSADNLYSGMQDSARGLSNELDNHILKLNAVKRSADDASAAISIAAAGMAGGVSGRPGAYAGGWDAAAAAARAAAAAGGAGFGGGGGMGGIFAIPAGGGGFQPGDAARHWGVVSGALATWLPRIHYAMMGFNELASTVGPALVAAGAAGAVGFQGGELAATRYQALNTVQEALGKSLNQTSAGFVGLKSNLQQAQNAANTGVWELAGAGINSLTGKTKIFTQMGTNTIAMLDTFAAKSTLAFTHGVGAGVMQQVADQGTHYLQQFGQIVGNIGTTFLHVAPNLPGVGGDLISTLQGATKAASWVTGAIPGGLLGTVLAGEAGARYGPTIVGGLGAGLGKIPGGIFGTAAHTATAEEIAAAATKGQVLNAGEMVAGTGAAGALGAVDVPMLATLAAGAFLIGRTATAQSPTQRKLATLQSGINQSLVGGGGINTIISAMSQIGPTGGPQTMGYGASVGKAYGDVFSSHFFKGLQEVFQTGWGSVIGIAGGQKPGQAGTLPTDAVYNQQALNKAATSFNQVLGAGAQVAKLMGVSLPDAFGLTQQALLQVGDAFNKNGTLTTAAKQQIANLESGYHAMNTTSGVFGKNVGAVNTALGLQNTQVSNVNTAWDQFTNNAVAGAVGASGLAQNLALAAPHLKTTAAALSGFGPSSAAAWAAFASPSTTTPGLLQQAQSQADWVRIAQTSGALSGGQGAGMTAYLAKQLLPYGAKSPLAASAIGILGQQAGMPSGLDQQQQTAWLDKHTMSTKQYNQALMQSGVVMSSVSGQAAHFGQTVQANVVNAMAQGAVNLPKMTTDMGAFVKSLTPSGGLSGGAMKNVLGDLKNVGMNAQSMKAILDNAVSARGLSATVTEKVKADISGAVTTAMLPKLPPVHWQSILDTPRIPVSKSIQGGKVIYDTKVDPPKLPPVPKPNPILYTTRVPPAILPPNPVPRPIIIPEYIVRVGSASGITPAPLGGLSFAAAVTRATGGMVPGSGSGDHVPALLEPGEAIVPKYLVPLIAPILRSHHVPGFAAGGIIPSASSGIQIDINNAYKTLDSLYGSNAPKAQIAAFWQNVLDPLYAAKDHLKAATTSIAKTSSVAAKAAADANKIATMINYARSVSNATVSGLNIAGMSVDSPGSTGMGAVPPGHPGYNAAAWAAANTYAASNATPLPSVQDQMKSYLSSINAFSGDLGVLGKKGLNKGILQQLIGAGPVQGDALAQSILGGAGGVGGVNSLFKQIQAASRTLGGTAAGAVYGGHPTTSGGQLNVGGINININVGGGGGSGGVALSTAQIKAITAQVQAALLKQAKTNRQTGIKLPGRGA